ncbi:unnamed protein product [Ambrosiozyma monospora]|uniref:Unnamed protein product n=1 Tax=Ambrosiozyma monospora TaxID=43982 RepID=A0ACB5TSY3_AMBMO|nr:unnamed protein product [Ambrosiozyma monospora]
MPPSIKPIRPFLTSLTSLIVDHYRPLSPNLGGTPMEGPFDLNINQLITEYEALIDDDVDDDAKETKYAALVETTKELKDRFETFIFDIDCLLNSFIYSKLHFGSEFLKRSKSLRNAFDAFFTYYELSCYAIVSI